VPDRLRFSARRAIPTGAIVIEGLWTTMFRNGRAQNRLYFSAGPNDESDGLFGSLTPTE
jgi:hypothetical protein